MKSIHIDKRTVFVISGVTDEKKINEAKFKLSGLRFGYGRFDQGHYWSLPFDECHQGFQILKSMFIHVQQI